RSVGCVAVLTGHSLLVGLTGEVAEVGGRVARNLLEHVLDLLLVGLATAGARKEHQGGTHERDARRTNAAGEAITIVVEHAAEAVWLRLPRSGAGRRWRRAGACRRRRSAGCGRSRLPARKTSGVPTGLERAPYLVEVVLHEPLEH